MSMSNLFSCPMPRLGDPLPAPPCHPQPAAQPSARRMDGASQGLGSGDNALTTEALLAALGAGVMVGHETRPPTTGTNVLGRKVLYLARQARSPRLTSNALSTVTQGSREKVPDEIQQVSNKNDMKTPLKKAVKETYAIMMPWVFVGWEAKSSGVLTSFGKIFKEEGLLGFFTGLTPHLLGDFLVGLLGNDQNLGSQFSQALVIRADTKFVMGIAMSLLPSSFLLVSDFLASPVFKSWIHRWKNLRVQGQLFRGSRPLFHQVSSGAWFALE
ncbi:hypothetical protein FD755_007349 [Muntiacus reevesi]|uniref:Uncharacterized protein n=1 Tax=Muntiacus reevesi TaxID=9886 RepID=A0A5J5MGU7_MUNRE|nr:hypothetical protein FD755_007349 [Muntiacus reevesi]